MHELVAPQELSISELIAQGIPGTTTTTLSLRPFEESSCLYPKKPKESQINIHDIPFNKRPEAIGQYIEIATFHL